MLSLEKKVGLIGIRSKTTKTPHTYFFSVESTNLIYLRYVEQIIKESFDENRIKYDMENRYHDKKNTENQNKEWKEWAKRVGERSRKIF